MCNPRSRNPPTLVGVVGNASNCAMWSHTCVGVNTYAAQGPKQGHWCSSTATAAKHEPGARILVLTTTETCGIGTRSSLPPGLVRNTGEETRVERRQPQVVLSLCMSFAGCQKEDENSYAPHVGPLSNTIIYELTSDPCARVCLAGKKRDPALS